MKPMLRWVYTDDPYWEVYDNSGRLRVWGKIHCENGELQTYIALSDRSGAFAPIGKAESLEDGIQYIVSTMDYICQGQHIERSY